MNAGAPSEQQAATPRTPSGTVPAVAPTGAKPQVKQILSFLGAILLGVIGNALYDFIKGTSQDSYSYDYWLALVVYYAIVGGGIVLSALILRSMCRRAYVRDREAPFRGRVFRFLNTIAGAALFGAVVGVASAFVASLPIGPVVHRKVLGFRFDEYELWIDLAFIVATMFFVVRQTDWHALIANAVCFSIGAGLVIDQKQPYGMSTQFINYLLVTIPATIVCITLARGKLASRAIHYLTKER